MRARSSLAQALWELGEREEAVAHYRDMLRLNPNDNQGNRYLLAACYVEMERYDALDRLLEDYERDPTAAWVYTRALAAFHREGDTGRSRELLTAAIKSNDHVPAFLLGWRMPPRLQDDYIRIGGESEAAEYAREFAAGWARTSGALAWLADSIESAVR